MNILILFEPEINILPTDFKLFESCNNAHKYWEWKQKFYLLKADILKIYGYDDHGYDLQIVNRECHSCNGTGKFKHWHGETERCYRCDRGIYQTNHFFLKRYILNGKLFYCPIDKPEGKQVNTINGLVSHPTPEVNPDYSYFCLLYKYDKEGFYNHLKVFQSRMKPADFKRWGELSVNHKHFFDQLATWYGVQVNNDDLPF